MQVKLPPAQEEFIYQKVAHGVFSSPDALISEAVNLLQQRELWSKNAAEKIEQGWNEAETGHLVCEDDLIGHLTSRKAAWKANDQQR